MLLTHLANYQESRGHLVYHLFEEAVSYLPHFTGAGCSKRIIHLCEFL